MYKGRPSGARNKRTLETIALAESLGHPVEFMLRWMTDDTKPDAIRLECAKNAAPYVSPKLNAVHVQLDDDRARSPDEAAQAIEDFLEDHARNQVARGLLIEQDDGGFAPVESQRPTNNETQRDLIGSLGVPPDDMSDSKSAVAGD